MYQSRFEGHAEMMARFYRALAPMPPREVDASTPSQIAALCGFDELDAGTDEEWVEPRSVDAVPPPPRDDVDESVTRVERLRRMGIDVMGAAEARTEDDLRAELDA